jgi:hypothetical protein
MACLAFASLIVAFATANTWAQKKKTSDAAPPKAATTGSKVKTDAAKKIAPRRRRTDRCGSARQIIAHKNLRRRAEN